MAKIHPLQWGKATSHLSLRSYRCSRANQELAFSDYLRDFVQTGSLFSLASVTSEGTIYNTLFQEADVLHHSFKCLSFY